jgi:NAD(P)H-dependent FMN reductase
MRILAISGSLRASSSNTALLQAAAALAPQDVEVVLYDGLGDLPHFNPDLDGETVAPAVSGLAVQATGCGRRGVLRTRIRARCSRRLEEQP